MDVVHCEDGIWVCKTGVSNKKASASPRLSMLEVVLYDKLSQIQAGQSLSLCCEAGKQEV